MSEPHTPGWVKACGWGARTPCTFRGHFSQTVVQFRSSAPEVLHADPVGDLSVNAWTGGVGLPVSDWQWKVRCCCTDIEQFAETPSGTVFPGFGESSRWMVPCLRYRQVCSPAAVCPTRVYRSSVSFPARKVKWHANRDRLTASGRKHYARRCVGRKCGSVAEESCWKMAIFGVTCCRKRQRNSKSQFVWSYNSMPMQWNLPDSLPLRTRCVATIFYVLTTVSEI